jgi:ABC-type branched-subunit amino acid transport system ATPase component
VSEGLGLSVKSLTVSFGGLIAVDDVSIEAPLGRITGLIGPNGAGKTTTFNATSGINRDVRGEVRFQGVDVSRSAAAARARLGLGRTFQRMELCDSLDVFENVALGHECAAAGSHVLRQLAAPPAERHATLAATAAALELCGIGHLAMEQAGALSTGQRRLVELARCLAGPFDLLLLDEPSSGLDRDETARFGAVLQRVVAERGCGILLVEHDMALVMKICEYIYVLDFGRMTFAGTPAEVAASEDVRAAYLGSEAVAMTETQVGPA